MKAKIAVVYFPGNNCEQESLDAIESAGMEATLFRWNEDPEKLAGFHGFILPGGWAYEDRIRAGAIAAKDGIMDAVREEASKGKPVIGICNGFQVLAESGLLPGLNDNKVEFALAPNTNPFISGYYCTWIELKSGIEKKNAFNRFLGKDQQMKVPIAHGEGRFVTSNKGLIDDLERNGQILFRYCDTEGDDNAGFPFNPNGSTQNIAGITNKEGNVLGMMPHPERANFKRQVPGFRGDFKEGEGEGPGRAIFLSMKQYIEEMFP